MFTGVERESKYLYLDRWGGGWGGDIDYRRVN